MKTLRQRPVTIMDVAEAAGVSIGTVSRFLNDLPVKPHNSAAVANAISRLGYRRNALATAMKAARTGLIGVLVPNLDEFHSTLVTQLTVELRRIGLMSVSHCHDNTDETVAAALDFFRNYRVDTLVMGGAEPHVDAIRALIDSGTPVITYDNPQHSLALNGVVVDNVAGARAAVGHLIDAGHRRIGILAGSGVNQTGKDRLEGWRQALEAAGLEPSAELIEEAHWTRVGGARGMTRLLDLDAPPTAIFGANYRSTIGALSVLRERGLRVPEDVSLVSFDDAEVFRLASPAITAIAQPIDLIARALAARVADICGKDAPATGPKEILPCTLIERASVAPPPNARTKGTQPNADS